MRRIIFLALVLLGTTIYGQNRAYRQFTMEDGLSQMKCTSLLKDRLGYLWIGTRGGLNRFDGEKFRMYTTADGLLSDRILALNIDSKGNLIIATQGGISVFDGAEFRSFPIDLSYVQYYTYLDKNDVYHILESDTGRTFTLKDGVLISKKVIGEAINMIVDDNENIFFYDPKFQFYNSDNTPISDFEYVQNLPLSLTNGWSYPPIFFQQINSKDNSFYWVTDSKIRKLKTNEIANLSPEYLLFLLDRFPNLIADLPLASIWDGLEEVIDKTVHIQDVVMEPDSSFWVAAENGLFHIPNNAIYNFEQKDLPYIWNINEASNGCIYFASYGYGMFKKCDLDIEKVNHTIPRLDGRWFPGSVTYQDKLVFANTRGVSDLINHYQLPNEFTVFTIVEDQRRKQFAIGYSKGFLHKNEVTSIVV